MDIQTKKQELYQLLKIDQIKEHIQNIQAQMSKPNFWSDQKRAQELSQELSNLNKIIEQFKLAQTEEELQELEKQTLFSGKYDKNPAILAIHAGAGGTEAQDWAEMLLRMFERWVEKKSFHYRVLEISPGEEAGIKSVTLKIEGYNAFGWLKSEAGVHRLVRLSPFDADHARHTSFVLVEVIPEIRNLELEIRNSDLRIDVYRSRGHGGQGVNTTDSAVRITHLPTGIVVACQNERSQMQNKATALKILQARLYQLKLKEREQEEARLRGEHLSAGWANQIRSYVLHPYQMVKDHRTGRETADTEGVLNGDLDELMIKYLKHQKSKR